MDQTIYYPPLLHTYQSRTDWKFYFWILFHCPVPYSYRYCFNSLSNRFSGFSPLLFLLLFLIRRSFSLNHSHNVYAVHGRLHIDNVPQVKKIHPILKINQINSGPKGWFYFREVIWYIAKNLMHFPNVVPIVQKQPKIQRRNTTTKFHHRVQEHNQFESSRKNKNLWSPTSD